MPPTRDLTPYTSARRRRGGASGAAVARRPKATAGKRRVGAKRASGRAQAAAAAAAAAADDELYDDDDDDDDDDEDEDDDDDDGDDDDDDEEGEYDDDQDDQDNGLREYDNGSSSAASDSCDEASETETVSDLGPPSPRSTDNVDLGLNTQLLCEITGASGESHLAQLKDLEVIFTPVTSLDGLSMCTSLKRLAMIDNRVRQIQPSQLAHLSSTLVELVLSGQKLTAMTGLENLKKLKTLYLDNNRITEISGLDGCASLQTLALYNNRITEIAGLEPVAGTLTKLFLQDNRIRSVAPTVARLAKLQVLALSGNRIAEFADIKVLAKLMALKTLSFADLMFAPCPVAHLEGYRNFVILNIKHVTTLDGEKIGENDHLAVQHEFYRTINQYNERLDSVRQDARRKSQAIEEKRRQISDRASSDRTRMLTAFRELQTYVTDERERLVVEFERQKAVRAAALATLETNLKKASRGLQDEVDSLIDALQHRSADLTQQYRLVEARLQSDARERKVLAGLDASTSAQGAVYRPLDETIDRSEFRSVRTRIEGSGKASGTDAPAGVDSPSSKRNTRLISVVKVHGEAREQRFLAAAKATPVRKMFMVVGDLDTAESILMRGFQGDAMRLSLSQNLPALPESALHGAAFLCRVAHGKTIKVAKDVLAADSSADLAAILAESGAQSATSGSMNKKGDPFHVTLTNPDLVMIDYLVRYERRSQDATANPRAIHDLTHDLMHLAGAETTLQAHPTLSPFEHLMDKHMQEFQKALWNSLSFQPPLGSDLRDADRDLARVNDDIDAVRSQIVAERASQDRLLRALLEKQMRVVP